VPRKEPEDLKEIEPETFCTGKCSHRNQKGSGGCWRRKCAPVLQPPRRRDKIFHYPKTEGGPLFPRLKHSPYPFSGNDAGRCEGRGVEGESDSDRQKGDGEGKGKNVKGLNPSLLFGCRRRRKKCRGELREKNPGGGILPNHATGNKKKTTCSSGGTCCTRGRTMRNRGKEKLLSKNPGPQNLGFITGPEDTARDRGRAR